MTTTTARKQKEIQARDALILSAARGLFSEQGYHATTMQNIADEVGYSKGTIYQHYTCKEDVLAKLYLLCGESLQVDIQKVIDAKLDSRRSILLITGVFLKNAKDEPGTAGNVTLIRSPTFIAKLASQYQEQIKVSEEIILSQVFSVFSENAGLADDQVKNATFGWWSMLMGVQSIMISGWDVLAMGFKVPQEHLIESLNIFLDGLGIITQKDCESWFQIEQLMEQVL